MTQRVTYDSLHFNEGFHERKWIIVLHYKTYTFKKNTSENMSSSTTEIHAEGTGGSHC